MKIYTKTGDKGQTSLIGGTRVPKHHVRIDAYGTVDELNSHIGLIRDQLNDERNITILIRIQNTLFTIGSHLASDPEKSTMKLPEIQTEEIILLEKEMDMIENTVTELRNFILPGGHTSVSYCHIARCVCRRAERCVIRLAESETVNPLIIQYFNRLSDYLFMLARKISFDNAIKEIPWKSTE
jgi:cob(I)alamin adenosyltransferase